MSDNEESIVFVEQFGDTIADYSSQYGSVNGVSYTANNLVGPPSRFPQYGDFSETYVPRTYGKWWLESPCSPSCISPSEEQTIGQDFIDVQYRKTVYPYSVSVYETYNVGCVKRLWAGDGHGNWKLLSEKPRQKSLKHSQIYSPEPQHVNFPTRVIRIEIDSYDADYYPEIDAVLLVGTESYPPEQTILKHSVAGLSERVVGLGLHKFLPDFDAFKSIENVCSTRGLFPHSPTSPVYSYLTSLPEEVLRSILCRLDLRSICSLSCTSKWLNNACKDASLFTSVRLKPYWYRVNRPAFEWLASRCHLLQHLNLSWCGAYGKLNSADFAWFIKQAGARLRILRLENCNFLNNESIYWISTTCSLLKELNLRGCRHLESTAFWHLGRLREIERLVLDSTQIELPTLLVSLQSMSALSHLSLAACRNLALGGSLDEVVRWLNRHRPGMKSLDMWRSGHLSSQGMEMLVGLVNLRELDLGWCGLPPNGYWIAQLANRSRSLHKLVLTAARVVTDADLIAIAQYCPELKQIDLLGNSYITPQGCSRILERCHALQLLDVSYCGQIDAGHVAHWKRTYPDISIKRIFINESD